MPAKGHQWNTSHPGPSCSQPGATAQQVDLQKSEFLDIFVKQKSIPYRFNVKE